MKKQRLQELAGIQYINEQSEVLATLIDTMSKELATDLDDDLSDPINVVIPEIIKRLTVVANDPKSGLSSAERAEIKNEIKKYQEALDTLANAGLVSNEANTSTQKNVVNEASIEGGDLVLTLRVPLSLFKDAANAFDNTLDPDLEQSPTMLKQLALTMEDDLDTWFQGNGGEWLEEGISENVYDDFLIEPTD